MRSLRHKLGISQEALAERADLHRTYIAGIERGVRNVTLKSIDKLARALQVSTATLLLQASGRGEFPGGELETGRCVSILMVEDNDDDVELALGAFKRARIANTVQVVQDGEEALDYLSCRGRFADRTPPAHLQLVLLDLDLPKVSGMEVLRRIKADKQTRSIPVVVLTASRDSQDIAECQRLGAATYIVKPVDFQGLSQATPQLKLNWALLEPLETRTRTARSSVSV